MSERRDHGVVVVTVTAPDEATAGALADLVVERRLAACAQVGGPIRSTYRWQGAVERATEWTVSIKTTADRVGELAGVVGERHPYDVPEIVAVPVVGGDARYLEWVEVESRA